ncbi:MAG: MmgE/PrpD family protein [Gammaproteobacteria bacterium]|nr:MmgE/PrpD family protein [Gammaproteobacteria bacterium]
MTDLSQLGVQKRSGGCLSQQLAHHATTTTFDAIPRAALAAAKLFLLDTLAVAWAGSDAPGCREAHQLLADEGGRPDATAWAYGGRLPLPAAAFINGMTSAALDYDALGRDSPVHVNVTVLPAAFAVAERQRASGRDFLAALIIGSDIMCRMGVSASHPHRGWSYTSVLGVFGAAAAAARLLRLDTPTTQHAIGLAFIQASGTQQANIEPSLTKRMLSAFAARGGVYAAMLAAHGITAPNEVIEGKFGLYRLYQDGDIAQLMNGLGTRFHSGDLSIKKYPSCGCNHTAIEATLKLVQRYDLEPDDVVSIKVTVPPYTNRIVGGPYDPSGDAQVAAQFNIRYSIACALVRRRLGLAEIQASAARDPAIAAHIGKVSVEVDEAQTGERGPVVVEMHTHRHGDISYRVDHVSGSVEAPLSEAEIDEKVRECLGLGVRPLDRSRIDLLYARVKEIEQISDMSAFLEGIC